MSKRSWLHVSDIVQDNFVNWQDLFSVLRTLNGIGAKVFYSTHAGTSGK